VAQEQPLSNMVVRDVSEKLINRKKPNASEGARGSSAILSPLRVNTLYVGSRNCNNRTRSRAKITKGSPDTPLNNATLVLHTLLREANLFVAKCAGDGNCLFRAIAICVYGVRNIQGKYVGEYHPDIRSAVLSVVCALGAVFRNEFENVVMGGHRITSFKQYCDHMSTPSSIHATNK